MKTPVIIEKWQKKNKYGRPGTHLNYTKVAIHYTGQADVPGINTVNYFNNVVANGYRVNGRYVYASAHFVIDLDGTIYQLIPLNEICYCTNSANSYAVAIEVATTGKDDHYTDATYRSMVQLCAWLCKRKGLNPRKDIIRHTDVVGRAYKLCPKYMVLHEDKYEQFRLDCYNLQHDKISLSQIVNCTNGKGKVTHVTPAPQEFKPYIVKIIVDNLNVRKLPGVENERVASLGHGGAYTIVEEKIVDGGTWGKLKSGIGWINVSPKYVSTL